MYSDTSVFGGVFDEEFQKPSCLLFDRIREGKYRLVLSALIRDELEEAPIPVKNLYREILGIADVVDVTDEAIYLQQKYLEHNIVGRKWEADALHVAIATVSHCNLIVSWNFKHIVNSRKISMYNTLNKENGYGSIAIHTPFEVVYEDKIV